MFRKFAAIAAIVFFCTIAGAQIIEKPPAYAFEKGVGTCTLRDVSLDQVWAAAIKALMQDKFRIITTEKASGTIIAERKQSWSYQYSLSLFLEQMGADVRITASIDVLHHEEGLAGLAQNSGQNKGHEKLEKKFFDKMAVLLYGGKR